MVTPGQTGDPGASRIRLVFLGHATTRIELAGYRVLTDPFLRPRLGPLRRHGPLPATDELAVDVVLISHGHRDHFDSRSIGALPGEPLIVVPRGLAVAVFQQTGREAYELADGESLEIGPLSIIAVHAEHWISPGAPRARPIGYLLDAGPRVYFAGDTGPFEGLAAWVAPVDLALLPVATWGPSRGRRHLTPRTAAEVLATIGARAAVPIHWGTLYPRHLERIWDRPLREPADRFAEHARRLAPGVDVRVLRPGEAAEFDLAGPLPARPSDGGLDRRLRPEAGRPRPRPAQP